MFEACIMYKTTNKFLFKLIKAMILSSIKQNKRVKLKFFNTPSKLNQYTSTLSEVKFREYVCSLIFSGRKGEKEESIMA